MSASVLHVQGNDYRKLYECKHQVEYFNNVATLCLDCQLFHPFCCCSEISLFVLMTKIAVCSQEKNTPSLLGRCKAMFKGIGKLLIWQTSYPTEEQVVFLGSPSLLICNTDVLEQASCVWPIERRFVTIFNSQSWPKNRGDDLNGIGKRFFLESQRSCIVIYWLLQKIREWFLLLVLGTLFLQVDVQIMLASEQLAKASLTVTPAIGRTCQILYPE